MKVAMIIFSPTGNTLKAGKMLEKSLSEKGIETQIINITRTQIFKQNTIDSFLKQEVKEHDLLCIGSPVYAHHLHYNVKEIIKSLPKPGKGWGSLAVPFVTYGGVNSGVALKEAAHLLKKTKRIVISGMKLNAAHCLTKTSKITTKINEGMPGDEARPVIEELANKIIQYERLNSGEYVDVSEELNYQALKVRIKASLIFREKFWQTHIYPRIVYTHDKCTNCGACAKICPVQRLIINDRGLEIPEGSPGCIHCGSCIRYCTFEAIDFNANWTKWDALLSKALRGEGPMASNEMPRSQVF